MCSLYGSGSGSVYDLDARSSKQGEVVGWTSPALRRLWPPPQLGHWYGAGK